MQSCSQGWQQKPSVPLTRARLGYKRQGAGVSKQLRDALLANQFKTAQISHSTSSPARWVLCLALEETLVFKLNTSILDELYQKSS